MNASTLTYRCNFVLLYLQTEDARWRNVCTAKRREKRAMLYPGWKCYNTVLIDWYWRINESHSDSDTCIPGGSLGSNLLQTIKRWILTYCSYASNLFLFLLCHLPLYLYLDSLPSNFQHDENPIACQPSSPFLQVFTHGGPHFSSTRAGTTTIGKLTLQRGRPSVTVAHNPGFSSWVFRSYPAVFPLILEANWKWYIVDVTSTYDERKGKNLAEREVSARLTRLDWWSQLTPTLTLTLTGKQVWCILYEEINACMNVDITT